ncbi:EI24 domain-containing protein [Tropicimonas sp.]|uniref:EI24 domain-containing protein n=1 Tax=Tropicimonas sp. TaxID=2067044 RepID=UPI003A882D73
MNVFSDIRLALAQITDRRFLRVLLLGLVLTVLLLFLATWALAWLVGGLVPESFELFGRTIGFADTLAEGTVVGAMMVASVFLMVPVASAFTGLFLEEIAQAVEERYYPGLPPAPGVPWSEALRDSLGFLAVIVVVNLIALALYFVSGPFAPFLFWIVNGYLLGREYFQLVAMRRIGRQGATAARRRHMPQIWIAGILMAAPLSVPIVNLFVPVLGVATFTHLYHRLETPELTPAP